MRNFFPPNTHISQIIELVFRSETLQLLYRCQQQSEINSLTVSVKVILNAYYYWTIVFFMIVILIIKIMSSVKAQMTKCQNSMLLSFRAKREILSFFRFLVAVLLEMTGIVLDFELWAWFYIWILDFDISQRKQCKYRINCQIF